MREESKRWIEYSRRDLLAARNSFNSRDYYIASFLAQQTAEKALKAVMVSIKGDFPKIHDLVILGKGVGMPRDLLDHAKELTMAYIYSRYPDTPKARNEKKISEDFISYAEVILKWAEKQL